MLVDHAELRSQTSTSRYEEHLTRSMRETPWRWHHFIMIEARATSPDFMEVHDGHPTSFENIISMDWLGKSTRWKPWFQPLILGLS